MNKSAQLTTFFGTIAIAGLVACAGPALAQSHPQNDPNDSTIFSDQTSPTASLNSQSNLQGQNQKKIAIDQDQDQEVTMDQDRDNDLGVTTKNGANFNAQNQDSLLKAEESDEGNSQLNWNAKATD